MPELPEVETMVRGLRPVLEGRVLCGLRLLDASQLQGCTVEQVEKAARGARIEQVARRGKWVVIRFGAAGGCIVFQPRMTGGFWLVPPPRMDHVRAIFDIEGQCRTVWFCDTRRLGRILWLPTPEAARSAFAGAHGPDALEIELADLARRLARTNRAIKPVLMDQKVLAGIGNIYADEILHRAGLHPQRRAATLKRAAIARLHPAIREVLLEAIAAEGASFDAGYRTVLGREGGFLSKNAVYGRAGQPCRICRSPIERIHFTGLIGRSTYLCPTCQPRTAKPRPSAKRLPQT
jgi:formamidopyrimidine-DNA glycosylase